MNQSEFQSWANKIGTKYQELTKLYQQELSQNMQINVKPKIHRTEEIHRCLEFDTNQLLVLFAYGHWDERSFAIACNQEDLASRPCYVSEVVCGWMLKTFSPEDDELKERYEFFSTPQEEGHLVTYFEVKP